MNEREIQNQIRDYLKVLGWYVIRNHQSLGSYPGIPDLTCFGPNGKRMEIEVKGPRGKMSDAQKEYATNLHLRGHVCIIARSVEDVMEHLK